MGLAVCTESVTVMIATAAGIDESVENIKTAAATLKSVFDSNQTFLGPHSAQIGALIEEVESISDEGHGPVLKLVLKLKRTADAYQEEINTQRYAGRSR